MKEPIAVEARFEAEGILRPLAFEWQGKRFIITNLGRQWEKEGMLHFLVMTTGDHVFELVHLQGENRWLLSRIPQDFKPHTPV
jgi:hypothetical protein